MNSVLIEVLRGQRRIGDLTPLEWDVLIPQSRKTLLLASLYADLPACPKDQQPTDAVMRHLYSAYVVHRKQCHSLQYELSVLSQALEQAGERLLLLKGAAYITAGLPAASGRLVSDIDILVREPLIPRVEAVLQDYGWCAGDIDPYDDRYYRRWMHEIPPLGHRQRGSTLDVHHTILPPTAKATIDPALLWQSAVEIQPGIWALSPVDMVLHSATHLFHEGEFDHGLRDLLDLDRLLRHFAKLEGEDFYQRLAMRALQMSLGRPLFYALRYTRYLLATPVPEQVHKALAPAEPGAILLGAMDGLFLRAFTPDHSSCRLPFTGVAQFCLFVRSHYLRMPLYLLLPHLSRKAFRDAFPPRSDKSDEKKG